MTPLTRRLLLVGGITAGGLAVLGLRRMRPDRGPLVGGDAGDEGSVPDVRPDCSTRLTRSDLDTGVALAAGYLLRAQKPAGDFVYEVNWRTGKPSAGSNVVRQAGATWGLALHHLETGDGDARRALDTSLAYWSSAARYAGDRAWISHRDGSTGTLALVGLALVDRLRAPAGLDDAGRARTFALLDGLIRWIVAARLPEGGVPSAYTPATGDPTGDAPNPYADGEALLLLCRAGIHLDRPDLVDLARRWAVEDHARNVAGPLAAAPDPDTTKGYYQWGSMSWYTLAAAGHDADILGGWLVDLARWMVHVHGTLARRKNTAYAYEGLLSAYRWAADHGDAATAKELACVAHHGLRKLLAWQLGHPLAAGLGAAPDAYLGGVQNAADDPVLRIDVTQHQLHALQLARTFRVDEADL